MRSTKRLFTVLVLLALCLTLMTVSAFAAEEVDSGICGDSLTWVFDDDGVLTISGTGDMTDYSYTMATWTTAPWNSYLYDIQQIVIEDGVTSIGVEAFDNCSMTEIIIPKSVTHIGHDAFYSCEKLTDVYYTGSESDWEQISIGSVNDYLTSAERHYDFILCKHVYDNVLDTECNTCGDVRAKHVGETLVKINGVWYYVVNGELSNATTLCEFNGNTFYVEKGKVNFSKTTLFKHDGTWYHIVKGKVSNATTLYKFNGKWYYIEGGKLSTKTTLCKFNGAWYYVSGGTIKNTTTLCAYNGNTFYVENGTVNFKKTTLFKYNGTWYHIVNGKVSNATTLYKFNGAWYYIKGGKVCTDTTLVKYNGTWYYVSGGIMRSNVTTLCAYNGNTFYVEKGKVNFNKTTLFKYNGTWYHIVKGKVSNATTLYKFNGKWYYIENGKVSSKTTMIKFNGTWYYVSGGTTQPAATTLVKYNGKWYYIEKGVLNTTRVGFVKYGNSTYYVKNGTTQPNLTGKVVVNGKTYFLRKGVLTTCHVNGHSFYAATCLKPKTCAYCGTTSGRTINHKYVNSVCTMCKKVYPYYVGTNIKTVTAVTGAECTKSRRNWMDLHPTQEGYLPGCESYHYEYDEKYALDEYEMYFVPYIDYLNSLGYECIRSSEPLFGFMDEVYQYRISDDTVFSASWHLGTYSERCWISIVFYTM